MLWLNLGAALLCSVYEGLVSTKPSGWGFPLLIKVSVYFDQLLLMVCLLAWKTVLLFIYRCLPRGDYSFQPFLTHFCDAFAVARDTGWNSGRGAVPMWDSWCAAGCQSQLWRRFHHWRDLARASGPSLQLQHPCYSTLRGTGCMVLLRQFITTVLQKYQLLQKWWSLFVNEQCYILHSYRLQWHLS